MPDQELQEFLTALQNGDRQTVEKTLRKYEGFLQAAIKVRLVQLKDPRLRTQLDVTDIFNSIFGDFLKRTTQATGSAVSSEVKLTYYLLRTVENKILNKLRKEGRYGGQIPDHVDRASPETPVSQRVDNKDFSEYVQGMIPEEKTRDMLDQRLAGKDWKTIGKYHGESADSVRKKVKRALDAVREQLKRDGMSNEG